MVKLLIICSICRKMIDRLDVGAKDWDNVGANDYSPVPGKEIYFHDKRPRGTSKSIGSIVRGYKIGVTKWFRRNSDINPVWQRDYYDHIIRDELELRRIRRYIVDNPEKWRRNEYFRCRGE